MWTLASVRVVTNIRIGVGQTDFNNHEGGVD